MPYEIGQEVEVYDPRNNVRDWRHAVVENVRTNVKSTVYDHVHPLLYDVRFLHDGFLSKGHFPMAVRTL